MSNAHVLIRTFWIYAAAGIVSVVNHTVTVILSLNTEHRVVRCAKKCSTEFQFSSNFTTSDLDTVGPHTDTSAVTVIVVVAAAAASEAIKTFQSRHSIEILQPCQT